MVAAPFAPPPERTRATVGLCLRIESIRWRICFTKASSEGLRPKVEDDGSVTGSSWAAAVKAAARADTNMKRSFLIRCCVFRLGGHRLQRCPLPWRRGWLR